MDSLMQRLRSLARRPKCPAGQEWTQEPCWLMPSLFRNRKRRSEQRRQPLSFEHSRQLLQSCRQLSGKHFKSLLANRKWSIARERLRQHTGIYVQSHYLTHYTFCSDIWGFWDDILKAISLCVISAASWKEPSFFLSPNLTQETTAVCILAMLDLNFDVCIVMINCDKWCNQRLKSFSW